MDDNHKYPIKDYQNALYNLIIKKKKEEYKQITRNSNNGSVNLSVDKSTSPTKKDFSYIKKD